MPNINHSFQGFYSVVMEKKRGNDIKKFFLIAMVANWSNKNTIYTFFNQSLKKVEKKKKKQSLIWNKWSQVKFLLESLKLIFAIDYLLSITAPTPQKKLFDWIKNQPQSKVFKKSGLQVQGVS